MEEIARSGLKKVIIGIALSLTVPLAVAISGIMLNHGGDLVWVTILASAIGVLISGLVELIGYREAGKACPHFRRAFFWEIISIAIGIIYFGAELGIELTKVTWLKIPTNLMNWLTIIFDLIVFWAVTRGCTEATDDEDSVVRLANVAFLIAVIANGLLIVNNIWSNLNEKLAGWLGYSSSVLLIVSNTLQIILIVMAYRNVFIPDDPE
ncbi:MAG: hypothetical protein MJ239_01840 [Bacilli bacterium]|nr:hypothetical protein [Bacilli bacterium]